MFTRISILLCFGIASLILVGESSGQNLSIEGGPIANAVQRVSLESSEVMVAARRSPAGKLQTRMTVQYLMVDDETRAAIYLDIDRKGLLTTTSTPAAAPRTQLDDTTSPVATMQQIQSPSRVTSCLIDQTQFAELIDKVSASPLSKLNVAPKIILLDGNEVEMTDLVQRPFVIDFDIELDVVKPRVHVLDEGTRLRLVSDLTEPDGSIDQAIELKCELTVSRVLDVDTGYVYGIKEEPLAVQVPLQRTTSAVVARRIEAGQSMLLDPHVRSVRRVISPAKVPILTKIPYVGRSFKNESAAEIDQHLLLLLQPAVEPMAR